MSRHFLYVLILLLLLFNFSSSRLLGFFDHLPELGARQDEKSIVVEDNDNSLTDRTDMFLSISKLTTGLQEKLLREIGMHFYMYLTELLQ